jgi:rhodanese-related sulfurtransferase
LPAWERKRHSTVSGVNVPSKAFGEKVHHDRNIPEITPDELKQLRDSGAELVILDVRTPEEFRRFCVPGGVNVPGGDLILWAEALRQMPETQVVVNCAGRTRSIIGTAALRRLGLDNVRALKNGTMGWLLAGLELETKPARANAAAPSGSREKAEALAERVLQDESIPWITAEELVELRGSKDGQMTYLIDARSESEYEEGHIPGSLSVPGGQAVQRADDFIAVRNARIIFASGGCAQAVMAAYWYRQMGFANVSVLRAGVRGWVDGGRELAVGSQQPEPVGYGAAKKAVRSISPADAEQLSRSSSFSILDVGASVDFETAHLPKARWISRGWLDLKLPAKLADRSRSILFTCPDGRQSVFAARTLEKKGYKDVSVLDGGVRAWAAAGYRTERGLDSCLVEPNDVVVSPSIKGDKEAMRRYLDWEIKLVK